ncbi:TetR/AcrR family transcriptional regulator C-terminal domain-containing protein [Niallia sp. 03133]|uniref:TetR/AcrR family transcriptional regulator C-terminal domain-containing protein n=1 Tax=Niallia sp. 03133 TaxID=3458060 RepID=UPI004043B4A7
MTKKKVNKESITEAALEILHEKGLASLSMRNVAAKLEVQAPALYWYIKNKQELLQLIAEYLSSQINFPKKTNDWKEEIKALALETRRVLLSVPNGAEIMMDTLPTTNKRLYAINSMLALFHRANFPEDKIFQSVISINNYVTTYVLDEQKQQKMFEEMGEERIHQQFIESISGIPKEEVPFVYRYMLSQKGAINNEKNFLVGLRVLLKGIEAEIKKIE